MKRLWILVFFVGLASSLVKADDGYDFDSDYNGILDPNAVQAAPITRARPHQPVAPTADDDDNLPEPTYTDAQRVLDLVNATRVKNKRGRLVASQQLNEIADHFARMLYNVNHGTGTYLNHDLPGGSFTQRFAAINWGGNLHAENIAAGQTSADEVVGSWLRSPGHAENIYESSFRYMGLGHYGHFWVQTFAISVSY